MALDVYLHSFRKGKPGGGDPGGALALLRAFGAELDDLGAWQVDLGDGTAIEVTGLDRLQIQRSRRSAPLSCLARLSGLTPRAADFLFGLAQSGRMAVVVPEESAPGGAYVLLPMEVDPIDLPQEPLFDAPEGIENSNELFDVLVPLQHGHWMVQEDELVENLLPRPGLWDRFLGWIRGG